MVTPSGERLNVFLNTKRYVLARDAKGARMYDKKKRQSQPGDPGGIGFRDWTPWGHDLLSHDTNGFLGREYGDGTDGRWGVIGETIGVDTLGPALTALTLSTYDTGTHAADLLGSTFILGSASSGLLGGAVSVASSMAMTSMKAGGVTYGYIGRGQIPAKVKLSDMTLQPNPPSFSAAVTDVVMTKSALAATRNEVSMALGDNVAWQSLSEYGVGTTDGWAANSQTEKATIFGITPSSVAVLTGTTVKQNILTGSVTMGAPNLATVSTLTNEDVVPTGFAMDRNLWVAGYSRGPYMVNDDTGEFTQIIPEIDNNTENCRNMNTWTPLGTILPLRDGVRYQKALQGQSIGIERFLGNASPVQGYSTGNDSSTKWHVDAEYNEVTGVTWLVASRPRQVGDQHPNVLSYYTIGKIPSSAVSRFVNYVGYANGERTSPAWMAGNGSDALYWLDGRTARFIDDPLYRFTLSGTTYGSNLYLNGVLVDIEAVEGMTANCTANRTWTPKISIDGGVSYVSLTAQTTNGFHRVLASSAGVPLATLQGANQIKLAWDFATNIAISAPQLISMPRVYWRWRPLEVTDYTWTFELEDQDNGQTAKEQETSLLALEGTTPVAVEDQDGDAYYFRVGHVEVKELADLAGNAAAGNRKTRRVAQISGVSWQTS